MKILFPLLVLFSICRFAGAQTGQQIVACGPEYPVTEFQDQIEMFNSFWMFPFIDGGVAYHDGPLVWYTHDDTAYVFNLAQGNYTVQTIPGSGDTTTFNIISFDPDSMFAEIGYLTNGQIFWLNNTLYYADYLGIREAGTLQYWQYPDSVSRNVMAAHEANGAAYLICSNAFGDSLLSVLKFDGSTVTPHYSTTSYSTQSGISSFVKDDNLYFNVWSQLLSFNTTTETFGAFDYAAYANLEMTPYEYSLNDDGNIVAFGSAPMPLNEAPVLQTLNGTSWEPGAFVFSTGWGVDTTIRIYYAENFPVVISYGLQDAFVLDTVHGLSWYSTHSYVPVDTFDSYAMLWKASSITAHDEDGNLYLFNPDVMMGWWNPCNNPFALYQRIFNGFFAGTGNAFFDLNANAVFDGSDYPLPNRGICNPASMCAVTDTNGNYTIYLSDSASNVVTPAPLDNYTVVPPSYSLSNLQADVEDLNFAFQPVSVWNNLAVSTVFSAQPPRPGFTIDYAIKVMNTGTAPIADTVVFMYDDNFSFSSANPTPLYQTGNKVAWLTGTINPLLNATFHAFLTLNPTTTLGTEANESASLGVPDDDAADDHFVFTQVVQGSYDPNDKAANPPYWTQDGEDIQYTIRFQNTGTDTAFNIVVRDTLDTNLDWSTFELRYNSHPVQVDLNTQNGALAFNFNNVLLPDSNVNEPASHGTVVYSIKTQNGLVDGSPIQNTAFIYFDYNLPVVTNTTLNVVGEPLGLDNILTPENLVLVPNPASRFVTLRYSGSTKPFMFRVSDVLGRVALHGEPTSSTAVISLSDLSSGTYVVSLFDAAGNTIARTRLAVAK